MDEKMLTTKEASEFLSITPGQIYVLKSKNQIPYHMVGKAVRFLKSELLAWSKTE